jgi:hypothetical protein
VCVCVCAQSEGASTRRGKGQGHYCTDRLAALTALVVRGPRQLVGGVGVCGASQVPTARRLVQMRGMDTEWVRVWGVRAAGARRRAHVLTIMTDTLGSSKGMALGIRDRQSISRAWSFRPRAEMNCTTHTAQGIRERMQPPETGPRARPGAPVGVRKSGSSARGGGTGWHASAPNQCPAGYCPWTTYLVLQPAGTSQQWRGDRRVGERGGQGPPLRRTRVPKGHNRQMQLCCPPYSKSGRRERTMMPQLVPTNSCSQAWREGRQGEHIRQSD